MKIGHLKSFGHNVADSFSSGISFMIGMYETDVYGEAAASPEGYIAVDFMSGTTSGSPVSERLRGAVKLYAEKLPELAERHGIDPAEIVALSARFGTDMVVGPHFLLTVQASDGRIATEQYVGIPGQRFRGKRHRKTAA